MVSIIVPVINEADRITPLVTSLYGLQGSKEIIISDGGSTDGTLERFDRFGGINVVHAHAGRASQMNHAASLAKGNVLWFVHADSILSPSSIHAIKNTIDSGYDGGFFKLRFYDAKDWFMNFIARTSHTRAKKFGLIFGDQGLFLKREVFDSMGGFADVALMEDWEISRRLRKFMIKALDTEIGTSARRYIKNGRFSTWLKMNFVKALYIIGVPTRILRSIYDGKR